MANEAGTTNPDGSKNVGQGYKPATGLTWSQISQAGGKPLFQGDISLLPNGQLRPTEQIKYELNGQVYQYNKVTPYDVGFNQQGTFSPIGSSSAPQEVQNPVNTGTPQVNYGQGNQPFTGSFTPPPATIPGYTPSVPTPLQTPKAVGTQATPQQEQAFQQITTDWQKLQPQIQDALKSKGVNLTIPEATPVMTQAIQDSGAGNHPDLDKRMADIQVSANGYPTYQPLIDTYTSLMASQGITGLQTQLVDIQAIMDGTADDIATEITKSGGTATASYVTALTEQRNKVLINKYNRIVGSLKVAQDYVDTVMGLTEKDRANQIDAFNTKYNIAKDALATDIQMKQLGITETKEYKDNMQKQITQMADNWGDYPQQIRNQVWQGSGFVGEAPATLGGGQEWVKHWENGDLYQTSSKTGKTELIKSGATDAENRTDTVNNFLANKKGSDGFVSASDYQLALQKWIASKGTQSNFFASFPQSTYLRQSEISNLPPALRPQQIVNKSDLSVEEVSVINDAKAKLDQVKQRYGDVEGIRQQIIDYAKQNYNIDLSPYI
jgi:hypothetical protein